jgi:hypothetical protein
VTGRPPKPIDATASAAATLGAELRARRVERELTLTQLGEQIGFRRSTSAAPSWPGPRSLRGLSPRAITHSQLMERSSRCYPRRSGRRRSPATTARRRLTRRAQTATETTSARPAACEVERALAEHCTSLLTIIGAHDAGHGPRAALPVPQRQLRLITTQREIARGEPRTELMRVEARWAAHVAWLCEDTGDRRGRAAMLEHALQLAREADYPDVVAWVRARQAQWTNPFNAIRLAEAGLRTPRSGAHTRALCATRAALAHAHIGDREMTTRLLADARTLARQDSRRPPLAADSPLSGYLVRCWEARCQAALEPPRAWRCTTRSCATGHPPWDDATAACTKRDLRSHAPPPASSTAPAPRAAPH